MRLVHGVASELQPAVGFVLLYRGCFGRGKRAAQEFQVFWYRNMHRLRLPPIMNFGDAFLAHFVSGLRGDSNGMGRPGNNEP